MLESNKPYQKTASHDNPWGSAWIGAGIGSTIGLGAMGGRHLAARKYPTKILGSGRAKALSYAASGVLGGGLGFMGGGIMKSYSDRK